MAIICGNDIYVVIAIKIGLKVQKNVVRGCIYVQKMQHSIWRNLYFNNLKHGNSAKTGSLLSPRLTFIRDIISVPRHETYVPRHETYVS